jgi:4a-hydroxytetrahydrobiopterin dehydratase
VSEQLGPGCTHAGRVPHSLPQVVPRVAIRRRPPRDDPPVGPHQHGAVSEDSERDRGRRGQGVDVEPQCRLQDQVAGADQAGCAGGMLAQHDGDAVVVLVEGDQFGAEPDLDGRIGTQVGEENRLEVVLGHGGGRRWADRGRLVTAWNPIGAAKPCGEASVSVSHASNRTSISPARTCSSRTHDRISSIVRVLTPVARGSEDRLSWRSTRSDPNPWRASTMAAVRPAGPDPTITTGVVGVWFSRIIGSLALFLSCARVLVAPCAGALTWRCGLAADALSVTPQRYLAGMTERIGPRQFHRADGVEDWRILGEGACTYFRTRSFAAGARLVQAISQLAGLDDHRPDVDLQHTGVTVRLITITDDYYGLSQRDVELARRIPAVARELGVTADPSAVQTVQVTIDALVSAEVLPFWRAVLGYRDRGPGGEDLIDPHGRGAPLWLQRMEAPRPQRNRIHIDVWVPHDQAEARVAAAIAAGGRLVTDQHAPTWWTLADAEGNEVDVCTWQKARD